VKQSSFQTILLTTLAMIAFASNSLLNRLALGQKTIDAISYTFIRLAAGAVMLLGIAYFQKKNDGQILRGNWISAVFLFLYAITFSLAYLSLSAGTGALILFGSVQVTMILVALRSGERPSLWEWVGLFLALGGLIYLVLPGLTSPPLLASALMAVAGLSWGFYTIRGRGSPNPLAITAGNFMYAVPMILLIRVVSITNIHISATGALIAAISGALASGVGYVIWYAALRGLTTTRAATVQLSVPVIAAWGGVVFLSEHVTIRLVIAGILILGGIALTLASRSKKI
jgi:drug/metabolite transporter (DMT)-like permease